MQISKNIVNAPKSNN